MTLILGRLWRLPASKSLRSWAGVTLTTPVPNSGSARSSRMMGISRSMSGMSALGQAQRRCPDLIILDLGLPDIDGLEVIARVRDFSAMPILVISARDTPTAETAAIAAGASDFLPKPFGIDDLIARIRAALPLAACLR